MKSYLIPANSKKSMLIFGVFNTFDLILFGSGCVLTMILLLTLQITNFILSIIAIMPALVTGFLVFPVPNYHNVLTFLIDVWYYFTTRRNYMWKGWCVLDEKNSEE